jgi:hypothetical protein
LLNLFVRTGQVADLLDRCDLALLVRAVLGPNAPGRVPFVISGARSGSVAIADLLAVSL